MHPQINCEVNGATKKYCAMVKKKSCPLRRMLSVGGYPYLEQLRNDETKRGKRWLIPFKRG